MSQYLEYWCSEVAVSKIGHYAGYLVNFFGNRFGKISSNQAAYVPPSNIVYTYAIPQVQGLSYNQAIVALTQANISYTTVNQITTNSTYQQYASQGGYVYSQTPPAGNQTTNAVVLTLYKYVSGSVTVPNIVGQTIANAA